MSLVLLLLFQAAQLPGRKTHQRCSLAQPGWTILKSFPSYIITHQETFDPVSPQKQNPEVCRVSLQSECYPLRDNNLMQDLAKALLLLAVHLLAAL